MYGDAEGRDVSDHGLESTRRDLRDEAHTFYEEMERILHEEDLSNERVAQRLERFFEQLSIFDERVAEFEERLDEYYKHNPIKGPVLFGGRKTGGQFQRTVRSVDRPTDISHPKSHVKKEWGDKYEPRLSAWHATSKSYSSISTIF